MPTQKPTPPRPGTALVLPRVNDDASQVAFDRITLRTQQAQAQIDALVAGLAALTATVAALSGTPTPTSWFDTIITPAQIASTVTDWSIGTLGTNTLVLVTSDASRTVAGLVGGADGKTVTLLNINATGGNTPFYLHEDGTATAANRFHNATNASLNGGSSGCVVYYYHGAALRWRSIWST